ncbi:chemotaxis protein CheY [Microbacterium hominis]|uniref:chemotaxis protein CheY n=1 Tax=Microbacterium TaxID=33882 RepID=UPI00168C03BA|nr:MULTISPECIES: chemotaxis protein CheY [Microbacterium]QOC26603.1 chemotaxis protein CheY [Microbacterium hominis]QOC27776.1 chemotaxis protein CheY [Microbacterium hominis]QYF97072.1 chemotaxis protein CheY [Microbacterium sp. PAMC21962]
MAERVAERVARLMAEHPDITVRFTSAVTADSYLFSMSRSIPVIFMNPVHEPLVESLRAAQQTRDNTATA